LKLINQLRHGAIALVASGLVGALGVLTLVSVARELRNLCYFDQLRCLSEGPVDWLFIVFGTLMGVAMSFGAVRLIWREVIRRAS
jgi:hypothetical protein